MENIRIREFRPGQIGQWLSCGYRFWRRHPWDHTAPFAIAAVVILILHAIPVIGDVMLLLLLPSLLSSAFLHVHQTSRPLKEAPAARGRVHKASKRERLRGWWMRRQPVLMGVWAKQENIFPLLVIGFVLVVLGLVAHVLVNQIGGQALASAHSFADLTGAQQLRWLLAYGCGILFWMLTGMAILWTLPLFAIRDLALTHAQTLAFRGLKHNAGVVAAFVLLVTGLLLPGMYWRLETLILGTILLWVGITLSLILLTYCGYCSFRLVFAEDTGVRVPANNPAAAPHPVRKSS